MSRLQRCVAIHDLSSFGRSSLTIVIPTLSAMGIQVCPVPTAVLSTHSGNFAEYTFVDLTDSMAGTFAHWKKLELTFEGIYSGFLGSPEQVRLIADMIAEFRRPETLVVVDPVLGDKGDFYSSIAPAMAEEMRGLVHLADVLTPNLTELFLLLGEPYQPHPRLEALDAYIARLAACGPRRIVVTSVPGEEEDSIGCRVYDDGIFSTIESKQYPAHYPGTGDYYTSIVTGALMDGLSFDKACQKAAHEVYRAIQESDASGEPSREGILLESALQRLLQEAQVRRVPGAREGAVSRACREGWY